MINVSHGPRGEDLFDMLLGSMEKVGTTDTH
jgi:hypothetical protein